uniref:Uncharacterized protein n=1 Tax=viral metagenome TaxID=1070528 RepID=A0A6C0DR05_9ZZZZ
MQMQTTLILIGSIFLIAAIFFSEWLPHISLFFLMMGFTYFVASKLLGGKPVYQGSKPFYTMSEGEQSVIPYADSGWKGPSSSLRFAIYVHTAPRVLSRHVCADDDETLFQPTCPTYEYNKCKCEAMFCDRCTMRTENMYKLLFIGDSLEFYMAGYSSTEEHTFVPALLKVRTGKDSTQHYMESISLPAIPFQKWTIVTIVKEGRRFDVYYGSKLVTTKLLDYIPIPPDSSQNWQAGNLEWIGTLGLFYAREGEQNSEDVERDLAALVDKRGIPFYVSMPPLTLNLTNTTNFTFGNKLRLGLPTVAPANPFTKYETSVA